MANTCLKIQANSAPRPWPARVASHSLAGSNQDILPRLAPRRRPRTLARILMHPDFQPALFTAISACFLALLWQHAVSIQKLTARLDTQTKAAALTSLTALPEPRLEDRFSKIGAVLDYLVSQRPAPMTPMDQDESDTLNESDVATVIVDKANLRSGPGKEYPAIMAISKGTRLLVEEQQKDWFRVVAPTGESLWVAREVF